MKTLKEDLKAVQAEMKAAKNEPEKLLSLQKVSMEKNLKYMAQSLKPMLITFIPIIFIFGWLRNYYNAIGNPGVFFGLKWLWAYIIFSIVFSIALRKLLNVH